MLRASMFHFISTFTFSKICPNFGAIAIVIFALWKPRSAIFSSYIFGGLYIASVFISGLSGSTKELIKMLPYLVTIAVLVFTSSRKKREHQPPAALGQSYFREER